MDIQNGSHELLSSMVMDSGLLIAVPFIALTQFVLHSLLTDRRWVDIDAINSREFLDDNVLRGEPATGTTHSTAGVEQKPARKADKLFRRRSVIVIER